MPDQDAQRVEAERRVKDEEIRQGIRKRPILASIIAVLLMLFGFFTILGGIIVIAAFLGFGILGGAILGLDLAAMGITIGVIIFLIGFIMFLAGIGLWKLRKWALYLVALPVLLYVVLVVLGSVLGGGIGALSLGLCASPVFVIALIFTIYFIAIRKNFT
jgi:hypothetical protein